MLRGLKIASRRQLPTSIRHGIANLYRPGNHAQTVLVALGIGVMFTHDRLSRPARRGRADDSDRAARNAERLPHRYHAQGSGSRSRALKKQHGIDGSAGADRNCRRQVGRSGWRRHSEKGTQRLGPPLPLRAICYIGRRHVRQCRSAPRKMVEQTSSHSRNLHLRRSCENSRRPPRVHHPLDHLRPRPIRARGLHPSHRRNPSSQPRRIHLQHRRTRRIPGHLLRRPPRPTSCGAGAAASTLRSLSHHHGSQHGGCAPNIPRSSGSNLTR